MESVSEFGVNTYGESRASPPRLCYQWLTRSRQHIRLEHGIFRNGFVEKIEGYPPADDPHENRDPAH